MELQSPIVEAMEGLELDRNELAQLANVAATTIEYTEKGIFANVPNNVLGILAEWDAEIDVHYRRYQVQKRLAWEGPKELPEGFPTTSDIMHPHVEWRLAVVELTVNEYCAAFCVPRFVIQKFESAEQTKFPDVLTVALTMACGSTLAEELKRHCKEWLNEHE